MMLWRIPSHISEEELIDEFGEKIVAMLVDGVTKLGFPEVQEQGGTSG